MDLLPEPPSYRFSARICLPSNILYNITTMPYLTIFRQCGTEKALGVERPTYISIRAERHGWTPMWHQKRNMFHLLYRVEYTSLVTVSTIGTQCFSFGELPHIKE
jgi:hypothetical protein